MMNERKFVLIFLIIFFRYSSSFNLNTNEVIVYADPENSNGENFFGYSLVLYSLPNKTGMYIGAPKSEQYSGKSKFIFNCKLGEVCVKVPLYTELGEKEYLNNNSWMGGAMDINHKDERVVVCEPRWIYQYLSRELEYIMYGLCYWFKTENPGIFKYFNPIESLRERSKQASFGISLYLVPDQTKMVLGAPNLSERGTSILYEDNEPTKNIQKRDINRLPNIFFENQIIARHQNLNSTYFGYSSGAGYFFDNTKSKLFYVSGAPRIYNHGAIKVYQFATQSNERLENVILKNGTQYGEYFGGSLTVGDINNDGYDDLIVGAPFHATTAYNVGRVYVFLGSKDDLSQAKAILGTVPNGQFGTTIQFLGDINDDNFGDVAISAPYEFENSGAVYIYRGYESGLKQECTQKIIGKNILPQIKGFGISISRAIDIDNNSFPDFAVGAHLSGHTVILRTKPVINISHKTLALRKSIEINRTSFEINVCFWFNSSKTITEPIKITRNVIIDEELQRGRLSNNQASKIIVLQSNNAQNCENLTIVLMRDIENVLKPIMVKTFHNYETLNDEEKRIIIFNNSVSGILDNKNCSYNCAVEDLDRHSSKNISFTQIPFLLYCGPDNICNSDIEFEQYLNNNTNDNSFIVGSSDFITLYTTIKNSDENSYGTKLQITIPELLDVKQMPKNCEQTDIIEAIILSCNLVADPLMTNETETIALHLDMSQINTDKFQKPILISSEIETNGNKTNKKELKINLKFQADMKISGDSKEKNYLYGNSKTNFENIFQLEKLGVSPINLTEIEISIPYKIQIKDNTKIEFIAIDSIINTLPVTSPVDISESCKIINSNESSNTYFNTNENDEMMIPRNFKIEDYLKNRTLYISCKRNGVICKRISCLTGPFIKEVGFIQMKMRSNMIAIKDVLYEKDAILFTTNASVIVKNLPNFTQAGNEPDFVNVHTLFISDSVSIPMPIWIIFIAILIGILLVILLIFVLIKAGFFKRKTKTNLENKKKNDGEQQEARHPDDHTADNQELTVEKNIDELFGQDNSDVFVED